MHKRIQLKNIYNHENEKKKSSYRSHTHINHQPHFFSTFVNSSLLVIWFKRILDSLLFLYIYIYKLKDILSIHLINNVESPSFDSWRSDCDDNGCSCLRMLVSITSSHMLPRFLDYWMSWFCPNNVIQWKNNSKNCRKIGLAIFQWIRGRKKKPINLHWEDNSSNLQDLIAQWKCLKHLET